MTTGARSASTRKTEGLPCRMMPKRALESSKPRRSGPSAAEPQPEAEVAEPAAE